MIDPVLIRIGPLAIRWYGVLIVSGAILAAYVCSQEARRKGLNPDVVWDMLLWVLVAGILGARLYHVLSSPAGGQAGWQYYRAHPLEALKIWQGGLAIYGALAGGVVGAALYCWRHKQDLVAWLDIIFPTVLLAQAIGRWGNYFNQEVYGYPTDLPWGIYIPPEKRLPGLEAYERFHPVFLYESIWCIIGFFVLMWVARRYEGKLLKGDMIALYFLWYPLGRIFTESLRPDAWTVGGIATAQIISAAAVACSAAFLAYRHLAQRATS